MNETDGPLPGWYQADGDPEGTHRYWDGNRWTTEPTPIGAVPGAADPGAAGLDAEEPVADEAEPSPVAGSVAADAAGTGLGDAGLSDAAPEREPVPEPEPEAVPEPEPEAVPEPGLAAEVPAPDSSVVEDASPEVATDAGKRPIPALEDIAPEQPASQIPEVPQVPEAPETPAFDPTATTTFSTGAGLASSGWGAGSTAPSSDAGGAEEGESVPAQPDSVAQHSALTDMSSPASPIPTGAGSVPVVPTVPTVPESPGNAGPAAGSPAQSWDPPTAPATPTPAPAPAPAQFQDPSWGPPPVVGAVPGVAPGVVPAAGKAPVLSPTGMPLADPTKRILARALDWLPQAVLLFIIFLVTGGSRWFGVLGFPIVVIYEFAWVSLMGGHPAKSMLGMRIEAASSGELDPVKALLRAVVWAAPLLFAIVFPPLAFVVFFFAVVGNAVLIFTDRAQRSLNDMAGSTSVVQSS